MIQPNTWKSMLLGLASMWDAWTVLGICYFDLGKYSYAANVFEKMVHLQHNDHET